MLRRSLYVIPPTSLALSRVCYGFFFSCLFLVFLRLPIYHFFLPYTVWHPYRTFTCSTPLIHCPTPTPHHIIHVWIYIQPCIFCFVPFFLSLARNRQSFHFPAVTFFVHQIPIETYITYLQISNMLVKISCFFFLVKTVLIPLRAFPYMIAWCLSHAYVPRKPVFFFLVRRVCSILSFLSPHVFRLSICSFASFLTPPPTSPLPPTLVIVTFSSSVTYSNSTRCILHTQ